MSSKIFKGKNIWLFDLDNTLYDPNSGIFCQIDQRMKKFISIKLKISENEAFKIQKQFYKKYGTTLYGLMKNHKINPQEFLDFVHDINFKNLKKSKKLKNMINCLPGQKIIYTNGDYNYATKILNSLGILETISDIFDIKKANYFPKPMKTSINKLIREYNFDTKKIVYFDDLDKNLKSANLRGITTIHISENSNYKIQSHIDFRFKTIINALDMIIKNLN